MNGLTVTVLTREARAASQRESPRGQAGARRAGLLTRAAHAGGPEDTADDMADHAIHDRAYGSGHDDLLHLSSFAC